MIALLRKELRLASDVLIGATVFLVASFPLAIIGIAMQGIEPFPWMSVVGASCVLNQYTMVLTSALLGAVTFVREQEEENLHFLAFLPLTRRRQLVAKLATCTLLWVVLWIFNASILIGFALSAGVGVTPLLPFVPRMVGVCTISFVALGSAPVAGRFVSNVTGAAFGGLLLIASICAIRLLLMKATNGSAYFTVPFALLLGLLGTSGFAIAGRSFLAEETTGTLAARTKLASHRNAYYPSPSARGVTRALVWKDLRLQRPAFVAGSSLICLPFLVALMNALTSGNSAAGFRVASLIAIATGWIVLPVWSAGALASEWETSSDRFLSYLPVSSTRIAVTKLLVASVPAVFLCLSAVAVFGMAQYAITSISPVRLALSWDAFNETGFVTGAVAYSCALPITFAAAWYFAARLRRKIVAIVLGILSGPITMASWAVTSAPGGYITEHCSPLQTIAIHATILVSVWGILTVAGVKRFSNAGRTG